MIGYFFAPFRIYPVQKAWRLGENEVKDYTIDVSEEVQSTETVSSAVWTSEPDDLTISGAPSISGNLITETISTPRPGQAYNVNVHVTTSVGKEFDVPLLIAGVDKTK